MITCRKANLRSLITKVVENLDTPQHSQGFPCGSDGKESDCSARDLDSIPGLGRSPGEGKGYPLQYSGGENSTDCIVHGVAKSQTRLSDFHTQCSQVPSCELPLHDSGPFLKNWCILFCVLIFSFVLVCFWHSLYQSFFWLCVCKDLLNSDLPFMLCPGWLSLNQRFLILMSSIGSIFFFLYDPVSNVLFSCLSATLIYVVTVNDAFSVYV